jgi:CheY-like chemotaxis protein
MKEVLIVDDEFDLTSTIKAVLEHHGYSAHACSSGKEALECIGDLRPALVLLDVMIPLGDGYKVLDRLRATPDLADTRVVLMNAVPPPKARPVTWQAFLKKPLSVKSLLDTVERLIGRPTPEDAASR